MREYLGDNYSPTLKPADQERLFQEAINDWEISGSKEAWDRMWIRIYECCRALALKIAPGKDKVEERAMDATVIVMDRIKRLNKHPNKLSSYCYWPVVGALQGPKAKREDMEMNLQDEIEKFEELKYETVRGICRQDLMNTED